MADGTVPRGLPTLGRDVLKLLFRNLLAQKDVKHYAGTQIAKQAAINKVGLEAIGHVTRRFRKAILTSQGMTLREWDCRGPAIVVTAAQFVWLVQWDMLCLEQLKIASRNAREWQAFVEHFEIPSLNTLRYDVPLHKPRKLADNSSTDLVSNIVNLNASSIEDLYGVPVWELSEPLPALRLEKFTYAPQSWDNNLSNLSGCVVDELTVFLELGSPDDQKIVFVPGYYDLGEFSAVEGTTNEHVRHVGFEINFLSVDVQDIEVLRRFLPNLASIEINADLHVKHAFARRRERGRGELVASLKQIGEYLASEPSMTSLRGLVTLIFVSPDRKRGWTSDSVLDEYDWVREALDTIAQVPLQLRVRASVCATFHHAGDAETKEADKLVGKLGFNAESFAKTCGLGVAYNHEVELSPSRKLNVHWTVYERKW